SEGFAARAARPAGATRRSAVRAPRAGRAALAAGQFRLQAGEPDDRLRVGRLGDQLLELGERAHVDVDALVLVHLRPLVDVREPGREEQVDLLVGEAGRGVEAAERLPLGGLLADL